MRSLKLIILFGIVAAGILLTPGVSSSDGRVWDVGSPIYENIFTPPSGMGFGINYSVLCQVMASDSDHWTQGGNSGTEGDTLNITWSATAGTFPAGNTGVQVIWKAPNTPGNVTITCTVDDVGQVFPPDTGTRDDAPVSRNVTVTVIRLEKVRVYYRVNDFPATGQTVTIRAILWATGVDYRAYTQEQWTNDGQWYAAGTNGPMAVFEPSPTLSTSETPTIYQWPSNWPAITRQWKKLYHQASAAVNHNRIYSYNSTQAPSWDGSWGTATQLPAGTIRYRVTAIMYSDLTPPVKQSVTSYDKEVATRISVRDVSQPLDPNGLTYLRWLFAYLYIPYEWGGYWFGGKDSGGQYVGGSDSYEGYGIDCSGLVCCGARHAGYNWDDWRVNCATLAGDSQYTDPVSYEDFTPGDILVKSGTHVVTCYRRTETSNNIDIIHASGDACKVWSEPSTITYWTNQGYVRRRLKTQ